MSALLSAVLAAYPLPEGIVWFGDPDLILHRATPGALLFAWLIKLPDPPTGLISVSDRLTFTLAEASGSNLQAVEERVRAAVAAFQAALEAGTEHRIPDIGELP